MAASGEKTGTPWSQVSLSRLRQILVDRFNDGELRDLCFDLGIDYESLPGEGKSDRARELIAHLDRRDGIPRLLTVVRRSRPDIEWNDVLETPDMTSAVVASTPSAQSPTGKTGTGDTFNMSGDFRGAVLNIKSILTEVQQNVGALQTDVEAEKDELTRLVAQLTVALQAVPSHRGEQAEAVAEMAKALIDAATAEVPNKTMVRISGEGLQRAAADLTDDLADVSVLTAQIVTAVNALIDQR